MSILHSIVPDEQLLLGEIKFNKREEIVYNDMLVEVEYVEDNIVLSRIINAPLFNYLDSKFYPGKIIGKRHTYIEEE